MGKILFKEANISQVDALVEIEKRCFSEPWNRDMIISEINNEITKFICIFKDDILIGFISIWIIIDEMHINNIAVDVDWQGNGYAGEMMYKAVEIAEKNEIVSITLEVRESNIKGISLYKKFGFEIIGKRKNYYKSPVENALLMKKEIKGAN